MSKKHMVKVNVYSSRVSDLPETVVGMAALWEDITTKIPHEYRESAEVDYDEGDDWASLDVYYYRLETDAEQEIREAKEQGYELVRQAKDLRLLAELKAKYE